MGIPAAKTSVFSIGQQECFSPFPYCVSPDQTQIGVPMVFPYGFSPFPRKDADCQGRKRPLNAIPGAKS